MVSEPKHWTIGLIAAQLQQPVHRVRYVIDTRRIQSQGRAGNTRIFSSAEVDLIRAALSHMARQKEEAR